MDETSPRAINSICLVNPNSINHQISLLCLHISENPCKNGNTRFKEDCEKAAEVFRYLLDPVRL